MIIFKNELILYMAQNDIFFTHEIEIIILHLIFGLNAN